MSKGNQSLVIKRTNTGLGLFTLRDIPRGKKIIEYVGPVITTEEANRKGGKYLFELDEDHAVEGSARSNTARYINHSCRPNAKGYTSGRRIWIWSLRAIKPGEEITINYGKEYLDEHIEQCKCAKCEEGPRKGGGRKRAAK
ncbi:MAG TPA: SET domain-containing protein [Pyrinomonadaceae bacterium]